MKITSSGWAGRAGWVGLAIVVSACSGGSTAPSIKPAAAVAVPTTPTAATTVTLRGYVSDTAFRYISGATIEVLDGPQAGMIMTSDANGTFSATGAFNGVTMRATKEGYTAATAGVHVYSGGAYVYFDLESVVPSIDMTGTYSLSFVADGSCTMLPDEVRARNYTISVARANTTPSLTGWFDGYATIGDFAPYANGIRIGVSGHYVGLSTNGEGPMLVEHLDGNRYVAYAVDAEAADVPAGAPTISVPFTGIIEYCELTQAVGQYYDCSTSYVRREQCTSPNGRLTLTRR